MPNQILIDFIQTSLNKGTSKEEIYLKLLEQSKKVDEIQEAFSFIGSQKSQKDTQKRTIQIVVMIGAVLIGGGIFSFVAANWQGMTRFAKVLIILAAMITSYSGGWVLKEQKEYTKTGQALYLLGNLIFGAGIFLVAQIFNIRANWPDGLILWMLGTLTMAFAIKTYLLHYLSIILGLIVVIGHPILLTSLFGYDPFLLTSTLLLLLTTTVTFITGVNLRKKVPKDLIIKSEL